MASLSVHGGNLQGAKQLWTSFGGTATLAEGVEGNGTKGDVTVWAVTVPETASIGLHAVRAITDNGVSPLYLVYLDDLPTVAQEGTNTNVATPQGLTVPVGVDGTVANLTMQYFKFTAAAGQRLSFEVLAQRLGSTLDPAIRLLGPNGRELAFEDDTAGLGGDCQLAHTFAEAGEYVLELRDIRYQGGRYRLRIGDFPLVSTPFPLAVQRGQTIEVSPAGVDVTSIQPVSVAVSTDPLVNFQAVSFGGVGRAGSASATMAIVDTPQLLEQEPNDSVEQAQVVTLGTDMNGRFLQAGDIDHYRFTAKKDETVVIRGITRQVGSPTDLNFRLLNAQGGQIATVDDVKTDEGSLTQKIPADGDYILAVEDLTRRGGTDQVYRIELQPSAPAFTLAASADQLTLPKGGTLAVTVTAARDGYGGPIELAVENLPAGVQVSRSVIGAGRNDAVLTLTAPADLATGQGWPVQIVGSGQVGDKTLKATAEVSAVLQARNSAMRWPPKTLSTAVMAAGGAPSPLNLVVEPAELIFGKHLSAKVKVTATRGEGLVEAITLAVTPDKTGLPPGITAAVAPIPKDQNSVEITFTADDKAPLGEFNAALLGTLKQDKVNLTQTAPALRLNLKAPLTVTVEPLAEPLKRGTEATLKVKVDRNPALAGPITVTLLNLPAGVTAAPATIAAEVSEVDVKLTAAADAALGEIKTLAAKGEAMAGAAKLEATSANVGLTVSEAAN